MANNIAFKNVESWKNHQSVLTIYEITKRALFAEFLMNENESHGDMICEKCMITWENYYEYLSKYFDDMIPRWVLENKPRLHREVTQKVIQFFDDYHYATRELPTSYKVKIITSRGFNDCLKSIIENMSYVDKKQKSEEPDEQLSFQMYYNFFNMGIEGLIKSMPEEFRYTLQDQIRPALLLMQAITRFTVQSGSNKKVPFVHAPDSLLSKSSIDDLQ